MDPTPAPSPARGPPRRTRPPRPSFKRRATARRATSAAGGGRATRRRRTRAGGVRAGSAMSAPVTSRLPTTSDVAVLLLAVTAAPAQSAFGFDATRGLVRHPGDTTGPPIDDRPPSFYIPALRRGWR